MTKSTWVALKAITGAARIRKTIWWILNQLIAVSGLTGVAEHGSCVVSKAIINHIGEEGCSGITAGRKVASSCQQAPKNVGCALKGHAVRWRHSSSGRWKHDVIVVAVIHVSLTNNTKSERQSKRMIVGGKVNMGKLIGSISWGRVGSILRGRWDSKSRCVTSSSAARIVIVDNGKEVLIWYSDGGRICAKKLIVQLGVIGNWKCCRQRLSVQVLSLGSRWGAKSLGICRTQIGDVCRDTSCIKG